MPVTDTQWAWFVFYTGGAALAWLFPVLAAMDWWKRR